MPSPNLLITHVTKAQNDKVTTINTKDDNLELALTDREVISVTAGNVTLTTTEAGQAYGNLVYVFNGAPGTARDVLVPTDTKLYICENAVTDGSVVTVKVSGQTGVALEQGQKKTLYCNGTDIEEVGSGAAGLLQTLPYGDVTGGAQGAFPRFMFTTDSVPTSSTVGWRANRSGSVIGISATATISGHSVNGTLTFAVYVNGSSVFTATTASITGNGQVDASAIQGAGIDAVAAGDDISVEVTVTTLQATGINDLSCLVELMVDV